MGLKSFKSMIRVESSYLAAPWEDIRSEQCLYKTLEVSESHRSTGTLCIPRPLRERRVVASTLRRRSYPKKRASGRATESPGPCNGSPSSWEVDSAPNWTLDLPYRRSPPPLSSHPARWTVDSGDLVCWILYDCQLSRGHRDHFRQILVKEVKKNTKEIIQLVDGSGKDGCIALSLN